MIAIKKSLFPLVVSIFSVSIFFLASSGLTGKPVADDQGLESQAAREVMRELAEERRQLMTDIAEMDPDQRREAMMDLRRQQAPRMEEAREVMMAESQRGRAEFLSREMDPNLPEPVRERLNERRELEAIMAHEDLSPSERAEAVREWQRQRRERHPRPERPDSASYGLGEADRDALMELRQSIRGELENADPEQRRAVMERYRSGIDSIFGRDPSRKQRPERPTDL